MKHMIPVTGLPVKACIPIKIWESKTTAMPPMIRIVPSECAILVTAFQRLQRNNSIELWPVFAHARKRATHVFVRNIRRLRFG